MDKLPAIDTTNKEFQDALSLIRYTHQSVFLTGKAGTGKSTFLKYVCEHVKKKHVVLAPTGVAAINVGGSTIHSFFKMPFRPMLPDDSDLSLTGGRIYDLLKYNKKQRQLLREVELIIIDEISMVRADMIDFIDRVLRVYSGNMRLPFGGKQLLLVGDVYQLEPVVTADMRDILGRFYRNAYFFSARVFHEMALVPIELQTVYRQQDSRFVEILDKIRNNTATREELTVLNSRYIPQYECDKEDFSITLATRRDQVDYINENRLARLSGEEHTFHGEIKGDFPEGSLPTLLDLVLKKGAQVMFIKNDPERRWVNGTIGIVSDITPDEKIEEEAEAVPDYPVTLFFTRDGYFKKITPQSLRMSGEQKLKDGDELTQTVESTNAAELLFFTSHCQVYKSRAADFADTKASVLGDYVASKLGMEEGEVPVYMAVTTDYAGHMLFFFQNGKCAKVPLSSYETKQNRKKLLKAYSDKAELACMLQLTDECELAVFTTAGRLLLAGSALIPEKTTRDTAGVNVVTLKKNQKIARVQRADGLELANPHRFRVRSLPAAGAILRAEDMAEQMTL